MRTITKNGRIAGWELEGLTSVNGIAIPDQGGEPWRVVAVQDMDGEGDVDFVWQNTRNGRAAIWLLDENLGFESGVLLSQQPNDANWQIRNQRPLE